MKMLVWKDGGNCLLIPGQHVEYLKTVVMTFIYPSTYYNFFAVISYIRGQWLYCKVSNLSCRKNF
jgi:hypothetical protein